MKLISCYLENFGCFNQKEFNFDGNLTVVNQENGYGKSTLVAFIKAMFYGLDSYRDNYKREEPLPERLHYYPFTGGDFGGNLVFSYNNKEFKIERFFAPKSETGDSLKVYSNGVQTYELGDDIGRTVFGVDKASFERLAFISSDEIEIKSTSSINLKLNEFLNGNDFDVSLDDAISKLDQTAKEYKKSRTSRDRITILQEKIADLNEKITNARFIENALDEKRERLTALKLELKTLTNEIETQQKSNKILSDYEHYEELLSLANSSRETLDGICLKYNGSVPSPEEISSVLELSSKNRELKALLNGGLVTRDSEELSALKTAFSSGVPTDSELDAVEKNIEKLSSLSASENLLKSDVPTKTELENEERFSKNTPTDALIKDIENTFESYKQVSLEIDDIARTQQAISETKIKPYKIYLPFIVLALAGVGLLFLNLIVGLVTLGVSLIGLVVALLLTGKSKGTVQVSSLAEKRLKLSEYQNKLSFIFSQYGYSLSDGVAYAYSSFKRDFSDYLLKISAYKEKGEKLKSITNEITLLSNSLSSYFLKFGINNSNFLTSLAELKSKIRAYYSLTERLTAVEKGKEELTLKLNENALKLKTFADKYGITSLDVNALQADVSLYLSETEKAKTLTERAYSYKAEKGLTVKPSGVAVDLSVLNEKSASIQEEIALLSSEIESDEELVEKIDGYLSEKSLSERTLINYKKNHELLLATKTLLLKAEQNLKDRYVKPVKDEFIKYSRLLEQTLGEKVTMTKDFEITFERNGKERSEKHLSSGVKSICALCFRLALIKNMYKDKSPFLILDDPFVFLDGVHFEKVSSLIKELSQEMQIVYFTCHESRTF